MERKRFDLDFARVVALSLVMTLGLSACGGSDDECVDDECLADGLPAPVVPNPNPNPNPSPSPSPSPGFDIDYSFSFTIKGPRGKFVARDIFTDSILKVRIEALGNGFLTDPDYSGFSINYGCISYTATVNGRSVQSPILKTPNTAGSQWLCPQSSDHFDVDFSDRVRGSGSDEPVSVTIENPLYSFYCELCYQAPWFFIDPWTGQPNCAPQCPVRTVYQEHNIRGNLLIDVNDVVP